MGAEERRKAMEDARKKRFQKEQQKKTNKDDYDDEEMREIMKKTKSDRTVRGDIERAKSLKIARERQSVLEARRKRMKSAETRTKMRRQFERQAAMLKLHLESKEESLAKRAKQTVWIEESQELFKKWHAPLKYIFNNYSKDFVSTRARSKDFTALSELSGGLTVGDWMIFCRDFRFVPHLMNKTQSLALFHLSNTELGVQDTELGARGGQQILSYNEFISCLRGVAMGEGFRTLPTMKERVIALGSFMRRQAYTFGPLKHSRPIDRFKGDTGSLKKRMGTCAVWERRCPLIEYVYMVPASLKFPDSLRIASEMVDLIASRACHIHTLTLCPVELEETEEEQEEAWAPKESK